MESYPHHTDKTEVQAHSGHMRLHWEEEVEARMVFREDRRVVRAEAGLNSDTMRVAVLELEQSEADTRPSAILHMWEARVGRVMGRRVERVAEVRVRRVLRRRLPQVPVDRVVMVLRITAQIMEVAAAAVRVARSLVCRITEERVVSAAEARVRVLGHREHH